MSDQTIAVSKLAFDKATASICECNALVAGALALIDDCPDAKQVWQAQQIMERATDELDQAFKALAALESKHD